MGKLPSWINGESYCETEIVFKALIPESEHVRRYCNYATQIREKLKQEPNHPSLQRIKKDLEEKRAKAIKTWLKPVDPNNEAQVKHQINYLANKGLMPEEYAGRTINYTLLLDIVWPWSDDIGRYKQNKIDMHTAWRTQKSRKKAQKKAAITIHKTTKTKINKIIHKHEEKTGAKLSIEKTVDLAVDGYIRGYDNLFFMNTLGHSIEKHKENAIKEITEVANKSTEHIDKLIEFLITDDEISRVLPLGLLEAKIKEFNNKLILENIDSPDDGATVEDKDGETTIGSDNNEAATEDTDCDITYEDSGNVSIAENGDNVANAEDFDDDATEGGDCKSHQKEETPDN